jgi:hypothetical protein
MDHGQRMEHSLEIFDLIERLSKLSQFSSTKKPMSSRFEYLDELSNITHSLLNLKAAKAHEPLLSSEEIAFLLNCFDPDLE